ncbi:MAG: hypothetical protein IH840_01065 [Candidatus Heimdallarchaeota archaeon]|nr:hypothetical protein [Candidatus Heimdallarchaeota archaeon]
MTNVKQPKNDRPLTFDKSTEFNLHRFRETLLIVIHFVIALINVTIYPLHFFDDQEILISGSMIAVSLASIFYLFIIDTVNNTSITTLTILIQFNVLLAAWTLEIPFYFLISSLLVYGTAALTVRQRSGHFTSETVTYVLTGILASNFIYWYFLSPEATIYYVFELLASEILIGFLLLLNVKNVAWQYFYTIPFIQILLLLPKVSEMKSNLGTENLAQYFIDFQLVIFAFFMLTIYLFYRRLNLSAVFDEFYRVLTALIVLLGISLFVLNEDLTDILPSENYSLTIMSIIFVLYITLPFIDSLLSGENLTTKSEAAALGLGVTNLFTFLNIVSDVEIVSYMDHGLLMYAMLMVSLYFARSENEYIGGISIWQLLLLLQFQYMGSIYNNTVQVIGFLTLVILKSYTISRLKTDSDLGYYNIIGIYGFIIISSINQFIRGGNEMSLSILLIGGSILWFTRLVSNNGHMLAVIKYAQAITFFLLAFNNGRKELFSSISGFENYDLGLIGYAIFLILVTILEKQDESSVLDTSYVSQGLVIMLILFKGILDLPVLLPMISLIAIPTLIIAKKLSGVEYERIISIHALTLAVTSVTGYYNDGFLGFKMSLVMMSYILGQLIPNIIGLVKPEAYRMKLLQYSNIGLMSVFTLHRVWNPISNVPHPLVIFLVIAIFIFSNPLVSRGQEDLTQFISLLGNIGLFSITKKYSSLRIPSIPGLVDFDLAFPITLTAVLIILLGASVIFFKYYQTSNESLHLYVNSIIGFVIIISVLQLIAESIDRSLPNPVNSSLISLIVILLTGLVYLKSNEIATITINLAIASQFIVNLSGRQAFMLLGGTEILLSNVSILIQALFLIYLTRNLVLEKSHTIYSIATASFLIILLVGTEIIDGNRYLLELTALLLLSPIIAEILGKHSLSSGSSVWIVSISGSILFGVRSFATLIDTSFIDPDYSLIANLVFTLIIVYNLYVFKDYEDKEDNSIKYLYYFSYLVLIFTASQLVNSIHPMLIGTGILLLTVINVFQPSEETRYQIPILQAFGFLIFIGKNYTTDFLGLIIRVQYLFFIMWVAIMLSMWYFRGIDKELNIISISIYGIATAFTFSSQAFESFPFKPLVLLPTMVVTLAFFFLFHNRVRGDYLKLQISTFVVMMLSLIPISMELGNSYTGSQLLIYRLLIDWLLFVPLAIEILIFAKPFIENAYSTGTELEWKKWDQTIIFSLIGMTVIGLVIGAERVFALKFMALVIGLWLLSPSFIRPALAWTTSLYTIFVYGYLVAQLRDVNEGIPAEYFYSLALFGIIMTAGGVYNDKNFKGEPLTTSLTVTGSVLTAISIIAPLFLAAKLEYLPNISFEDVLIEFLVNIVWAAQGLILFSLSRRMSKDYLRRLALAILIADIIKTAIDIFQQIENDLIRIIGSMALGGVLIYIFYLFSADDEIPVKIE